MVQYLVENGGEIDATTMNGGTPLTRAIETSKEDVVQYLIDRGAKMQTENKKGGHLKGHRYRKYVNTVTLNTGLILFVLLDIV